jgi:hypothetical protein
VGWNPEPYNGIVRNLRKMEEELGLKTMASMEGELNEIGVDTQKLDGRGILTEWEARIGEATTTRRMPIPQRESRGTM